MTPRKIAALRPTLAPLVTSRETYLLTYLAIATFGAVAGVRGAPSIDLTTPEGYRSIWAFVVVLSGGLSFAACLFDRPRWERWSVLAMLSAASGYVFSAAALALAGDENRQSFAIVTFVLLILPTSRFLDLLPKRKVADQ